MNTYMYISFEKEDLAKNRYSMPFFQYGGSNGTFQSRKYSILIRSSTFTNQIISKLLFIFLVKVSITWTIIFQIIVIISFNLFSRNIADWQNMYNAHSFQLTKRR